ncbi:contractile injection system protein, VgrG/Pvc8 family [Brevibacillus gelatini]
MSLSVIAYNNLQVSPYELIHLVELTITKKMNEHARLTLTGIVPEEMKDSYVQMTQAQTPIEISQVDSAGNATPLFAGIVLEIGIKAVRDVFYLSLEAVSPTYNLDVKRKSRSFQNKAMSYGALLQQIGADYPGIDIMDMASNGQTLGKFTMQYQETDWQFLKRMASRFQTGLMPASVFDKPKFSFGVPEGPSKAKLEDFNYRVRKNISEYRYSSENGVKGIDENDYIYYEVETDRVLDLGNGVDFKGKSLYVYEAHTEMKKGLLKHKYLLASKKGMSQKPIYQSLIVGASVQGRVIDVAKDNVKVHLDIDEKQSKSEAHWFPYSSVYTAEGNSGWYCMPELDDYVRIYFPTNKEEDGIAISSVRKNSEEGETNKLGNPDIKYFRTANGKELMFSPQEIVISAKDGEILIRLNEADGIQILSKKNIKVVSDQDIMMDSATKVIISAKNEISLTCKESSIKMDGNTSIIGQELKTN